MKDYRQFLFEAESKIKMDNPIKYKEEVLQILKRDSVGLTSKKDKFIKDEMKDIYDKYCIIVPLNDEGTDYNFIHDVIKNNTNRRNKIDFSKPIMNMSSIDSFISTDKNANIFNKVSEFKLSDSKKLFMETFKDSKFIPKTVYSLNDIEDLKLPIIAKPDNGNSALGIEMFKTYDEARKSNLKFDLWSEAKELSKEFRAYVIDDKIIAMTERVTNQENDKSVGKKKASEKIDLIYIDLDLSKFKYLKTVEDIKNEIGKKTKLDFYVIDLMIDTDDNFWVPEINGAPGITPGTFYEVYKAWIKFTYGNDIAKEDDVELSKIRDEYIKKISETYPKEYKYASNPL